MKLTGFMPSTEVEEMCFNNCDRILESVYKLSFLLVFFRMSHQNVSDMMSMWIHFREKEIILFSFWKTSTFSGIGVSMFISFLLCILYEAIKGFRLFLAISHAQQRRQFSNRSQSPLGGGDNVSQESVSFAPLLQLSGLTKRLFTSYRILQGALYGIQALLAYVLMLIVMTFNGNLILSIVIGEAVGYFLFTGNPLFDNAVADCC